MSEDVMNSASGLVDNQGWDEYWSKQNHGGILYAVIAEFYRKRIIRPTLNHFIRKYFPKGSTLLHAGCGSGQVDFDIKDEYQITGLDISRKALEIFRVSNENKCKTIHASIFDTRLPDESIDGVYNLGVMEHFTREEIQKILLEFRRILKPGGKAVLFWPPEYGASVLFFKSLKSAFRIFLRKDVKFHPDEISRLECKSDAMAQLEQAGYRVDEYSFGPRDAFTYAIVVASKIHP